MRGAEEYVRRFTDDVYISGGIDEMLHRRKCEGQGQ